MSGRPIDPTVWATGTPNYPAGILAWSGTTTVNIPPYNFFTPGVPPAAQEINQLFNQLSQTQKDMMDFVGQLPAQNWKYTDLEASVLGLTLNCTAFDFDPLFAKSVFARKISNNNYDAVTTACNADTPFYQLGGTIFGAVAGSFVSLMICGNGDGADANLRHTAVFIQTSAGNNVLVGKYDPVTDTVSGPYNLGNQSFRDGFMFKGKYVAIGEAIDPYHSPCFASSVDCVTWTDRAPAQVAPWGSRFNTTEAWACAASPDMIVVLPRMQLLGTNFSAPLPFVMVHTTDGITWLPTGFPVDGVQGVCWDSVRSQWVAAVSNIDGVTGFPTGTGTDFWTSPDGLVWTEVASIAGISNNAFVVSGIAAIGTLLIAITTLGDVLCSYDGAFTWRQVGYQLWPVYTRNPPVGFHTPYLRPSIKSNGSRCLLACPSRAAFSLNAGIGQLVT